MDKLKKRLITMKPLSVSTSDGTRLSFEDGWLLIRPSGTEAKIRVTAEAKNEAKVRMLYTSGVEAIQECIDTGAMG